MKKPTLITVIATALLFGCSKKDIPQPDASGLGKTELAFAGTSLAQAAASSTYTDESAFVASLSSYGFKNPTQLSYNRTGQTNYTSAHGFNIPAANRAGGFKWNAGDEETAEWRPQGIAGFTMGGRRFILTTWYGTEPDDVAGVHNGHKGVRLALADITDLSNVTYRLILLVQQYSNTSNSLLWDNLYAQDGNAAHNYTKGSLFAPITIHAGGVAIYGTKVYVADTGRGLRVFDLNNFIAVSSDSESQCGKMANNTLQAFNYGYILPETGWYQLSGASPYSCVEFGEGNNLWFGQYYGFNKNGTGTPPSQTPAVSGFALNTSGQLTGAAPTAITPRDDIAGDTKVFNMQGAYRKGTQTFMSITNNSEYEGSTARFLRYNDGAALGVRYRWPHGAEDLYYESATGLLWCLTEFEKAKYGSDNRCVFAVRLTDYD
ncbi:hypothetical protein EZ449_05995 [Pedobacter frigidisoli]|uniref:Uncharacterized protein n=2 Tax=Pedobacter frigidisoli TaxID=2530455 RepID=A0A4V2MN46_9SPHI|nr:hypothetical protein EZ449_05995 [Pedobacter frigidisoli]